jgi:hypothetical protein
MSSREYAERLARAIKGTGLADIANTDYTEDTIRLLCRLRPGADKEWIELVKRVLIATEREHGHAHSWASHICKRYFLLDDDDPKAPRKLVFGWNFSISSTNMTGSLDFLIKSLRAAPSGSKAQVRPARREVTEMELSGSFTGAGKKGGGGFNLGEFPHPGRR